jgi:predicted SprT family Zn-dependent metalloprotease
MEKHKNLKRMLISDYEEEGLDAYQIALTQVFNYSNETIDLMNETSDLIEDIVKKINKKILNFFPGEKLEVQVIVYHGLGNSAGWATTYQNINTILLGIEKIVELKWNSRMKLEDLISHEYAHLIHSSIVGSLEKYTDFYKKMVYRVYTEGFATFCENMMNGRELSMPSWYQTCIRMETKLKKEFLYRLENKQENCLDFFGDWYKVYDIAEAGYFLGLRLITILNQTYSISEIMELDFDVIDRYFLEYMSNY